MKCAYPPCSVLSAGKEGELLTEDKKYFFCSLKHKYHMRRRLSICSLCPNYTTIVCGGHTNNCKQCATVCDKCVYNCKVCVTCNGKLKDVIGRYGKDESRFCDYCISIGEKEFIICSSRCFHNHIHSQQQNRIISGDSSKYGCRCEFPINSFYNCESSYCRDARFCSYECLQEHYTIDTSSILHNIAICKNKNCKELIYYVPKKESCKNVTCCNFCSEKCKEEAMTRKENCCKCGCTKSINGLCNRCRYTVCIECKGEKYEQCHVLEGQKCEFLLCKSEECKRKHLNIVHKLNRKALCDNKGCYNDGEMKYRCNCGNIYCSEECKKMDNLNGCSTCECSHTTILCHEKDCKNKTCKVCCRFCIECKNKLLS